MDSLAHEIVAFDSHDPRRIDLLQELLLLNELAAEMRKTLNPLYELIDELLRESNRVATLKASVITVVGSIARGVNCHSNM